MLKQSQYFIVVLLFILLITALLTFFISFQIMPPQEEEIPRRSRPVFAPQAEWEEELYKSAAGRENVEEIIGCKKNEMNRRAIFNKINRKEGE